jgi:hypothetical protein
LFHPKLSNLVAIATFIVACFATHLAKLIFSQDR